MNLSFVPCSPEVTTKGSTVTRRFEVVDRNARYGQLEIDALQSLAQPATLTFPCAAPLVPGRSVYLETASESDWRRLRGIDGMKAKGAFGLKAIEGSDDGKLELVLPSPELRYGKGDHWHIHLERDLSIRSVTSTPKALNTLTLEGARREMECHVALAACDAGLPGFLAGEFWDGDSRIVDFQGRATGAVFLQHDPNAQLLSEYMLFLYWEHSETRAEILPPASGHMNTHHGHPLAELVENYAEFMGMLAQTKGRAIFEAGVMRHASHIQNFLMNPRNGKVLQADNDTCLRRDAISPELLVPQLIRDAASSLGRLISDLSLCAFSNDWKLYLQGGQPLFLPYLSGLFGRFASRGAIVESATKLQDRYIEFVNDRKYLDPLAENYRREKFAGKNEAGKILEEKWHFIHTAFMVPIIGHLYLLCRRCDFPGKFIVPSLDIQSLRERLYDGIDLFRKNLTPSK